MAAADQSGSLGGLVSGLAADLGQLVKGEIALARTELDAKFQTFAAGGVYLLGGALVGFAGLVVLLQGVAFALATIVVPWLAWLLVGLAIVAIGVVIARYGLSSMTLKTLTPEKTAESLQKDITLVKEHI